MTDTEAVKKEYEIAFLVRTEEDAADITKILALHECELKGEGVFKKIALAYKIQKETQAVFGILRFVATGEAVKAVEHDLRTATTIMRSMILAVQKPKKSSQGGRGVRPVAVAPAVSTLPLSNEALEKKIEEILQ